MEKVISFGDQLKVEGINFHKYGAHIFHTNNNKVWNYITQDNTVKACEELNPILNLKEIEAVTLTNKV